MTTTILIDSGVLVALLSREDQFHEWAVRVVSNLPTPFLTCEAVITETCFLLGRYRRSHQPVFTLIHREALALSFDLGSEFQTVSDLMTKYQTVPMSLADACLVRMSEQFPRSQVLTLDSDFRIYRRHRDQPIPTLTP